MQQALILELTFPANRACSYVSTKLFHAWEWTVLSQIIKHLAYSHISNNFQMPFAVSIRAIRSEARCSICCCVSLALFSSRTFPHSSHSPLWYGLSEAVRPFGLLTVLYSRFISLLFSKLRRNCLCWKLFCVEGCHSVNIEGMMGVTNHYFADSFEIT